MSNTIYELSDERKMKHNPDELWLDSYWKLINVEPIL